MFLVLLYIPLGFILPRLVLGLRCFAGDPIHGNECTSLTFCISVHASSTATALSPAMQWACDGNGANQISWCASQGFRPANAPLFDDRFGGDSQEFERQTPSRITVSRTAPSSASGGNGGGFLPSSIAASASGDRRTRFPYPAARRRCFDAGDFGEICCCTTDYCNRANGFRNRGNYLLPLVVILFSSSLPFLCH